MKRRIETWPPQADPRIRYFDAITGFALSDEAVTELPLIIRDEVLSTSLINDVYNPCYHSKTIVNVNEATVLSYDAPYGSIPTALNKAVECPGRLLYEQALQALGPLSKQVDFAKELHRQCLRQEQISRFKDLRFVSNDPNFSLVVFLAELKECKKIIPGLRKHFSTLKKAIKRSKGRASTLADLFAGGWLDWSFGTGAFVRDLIKLWKLFCNMNSKYRDFVAGMGEVKNTSHIVELTLFPPLPHAPVTRRIGGVDWTFSEVWTVGSTHVREPYSCLSVSYKYYSDGLTGLFGWSKHAAQNLGVVPDPSIIWDLIPLSFVLDWFVPVGEWLHRHRVDLYDVTLRLVGAGYGTRVTLRRTVKVTRAFQVGSGTPLIPATHTLGETYTRFYERRAVSAHRAPNDLQMGQLTFNKVLSGAALTWVLSTGDKPKLRKRK